MLLPHLLARNAPTDPACKLCVFYLHSCPQARDTKIFPTAHVIQLQSIQVSGDDQRESTLKESWHLKKNPGWNFPELKAENQVSLTSICFASVQRCSFIFCEHKQHNMALPTRAVQST